jgi:hypothetical protein
MKFNLEINLELWRVIWGQILVADPKAKKNVIKKRLIFTSQKISYLALHTASPEPIWGQPVKSRKIDRKIDFFGKFLKNKKILRLKMTRKKFSTR